MFKRRIDYLNDEKAEKEITEIREISNREYEYRVDRIASELLGEISKYIFDNFTSHLPSIGGLLSLKLINNGDRLAQDIKILLPNYTFATIYKDGNETDITHKGNSIEINEIRPNEKIRVEVWLYGLSPSRLDKISISHKDGVGDTLIYRDVPGWLYNFYFYLGWPLFFILFGVCFMIYAVFQDFGNRAAHDKTEENKE